MSTSSQNAAAVVFTYKSVEHILETQGTQSWRMHRSHFGSFKFVICTRNRRHARAEGSEEHGSAFLIGKVRDIVPSTDPDLDPNEPPRFLIRMTEAALVPDKPGFWKWGRWPVHYDSLEALGIDPGDYDFKPLSDLLEEVRKASGHGEGPPALVPLATSAPSKRPSWKDSIDRAKAVIVADQGVDADAIEINIRF